MTTAATKHRPTRKRQFAHKARALAGLIVSPQGLAQHMGGTLAQAHVVLRHLARRGEAERVRDAGIGRHHKQPGLWKIYERQENRMPEV